MELPIVVGNWKMNLTVMNARELALRLVCELDEIGHIAEVIVCPPFIDIETVCAIAKGSGLRLGAQNVYYEPDGAFTGEISASMLKEMCEFVIVGHSERRNLFAESDETVSRKIAAVQQSGMRPILCVGELIEQRETDRALEVIELQLRKGLDRTASCEGLVVAYEPVWAIGTGIAATPHDAQDMMSHIRNVLRSIFGESGTGVPLLYGGSVTADNVADFVDCESVDGTLVGGASLDAKRFLTLIKNAASIV